MKKILLILALNGLLITGSQAQVRNYLTNEEDTIEMYHIDSLLAHCLDNFQSPEDLIFCLKSHTKLWEDSLNNSMRKLLALMDTSLQNKFREAQYAWKMDMDNDIKLWEELYSKKKGWYGEESNNVMLQYFLDKTRERALDMRFFLKDFMMQKQYNNVNPNR